MARARGWSIEYIYGCRSLPSKVERAIVCAMVVWLASVSPRDIAAAEAVMNAQDLADFLHVHIGTVLKLVKRGEITGFKVGEQWRFELETVDRWTKRAEPR